MELDNDNQSDNSSKGKGGQDPLKKGIGIWQKRWPEDMSSVEIAKKLRKGQWDRSRDQ